MISNPSNPSLSPAALRQILVQYAQQNQIMLKQLDASFVDQLIKISEASDRSLAEVGDIFDLFLKNLESKSNAEQLESLQLFLTSATQIQGAHLSMLDPSLEMEKDLNKQQIDASANIFSHFIQTWKEINTSYDKVLKQGAELEHQMHTEDLKLKAEEEKLKIKFENDKNVLQQKHEKALLEIQLDQPIKNKT